MLCFKKITAENHETTLPENKELARHRSLQLLYAHYVCFHVFLQCAAAADGQIMEIHKLRGSSSNLHP